MKKYLFRDYCELLAREGLVKGPLPLLDCMDRRVELVSCDSQNVVPGTLFLVKGAHFKEQYLLDAANRGAFCYISQREYPNAAIPCLRVESVRLAMAKLASFYYNDPWRELELIGITGTKGKSSTAYFIKSILDQYLKDTGGGESGLVSSIQTYDGVERFESHLTTPEPLDLERHFANAAASGIRYLTMEVSSQALKYDRVLGVGFSVACFLNIGYDHISPIEHPDWADYFASKLRIFEQCGAGVVNLDSDHAGEILAAARAAGRVVTFSVRDPRADVYGYDIRKQGGDTLFRVRAPGFGREFRLGIPGLFNVPNALAAISACLLCGVPEKYLYPGLLRARVPGRMEVYASAGGRVTAIVDYAHNRLSFETLFQSVREEYPGRPVVIVFGCPGKKALDRRHDLGEIAGRYARHVYLTEEDPGEEDAAEICREIARTVAEQGCPYTIDPDRGSAIRSAVMDAGEGTVVLVTGKGAEKREKRGLEYVPVPSDVEYVRQALRDYDRLRGGAGVSKER